jgi:hypothetical protein
MAATNSNGDASHANAGKNKHLMRFSSQRPYWACDLPFKARQRKIPPLPDNSAGAVRIQGTTFATNPVSRATHPSYGEKFRIDSRRRKFAPVPFVAKDRSGVKPAVD